MIGCILAAVMFVNHLQLSVLRNLSEIHSIDNYQCPLGDLKVIFDLAGGKCGYCFLD